MTSFEIPECDDLDEDLEAFEPDDNDFPPLATGDFLTEL